ncbi:MAG: HAMP domain-containing sensor histidine kinase [bacterium]|nr:HAMP domain-containing sensor histidine kinase [bacterium]
MSANDFARQGERLIAMGQMAASLAHELRNPLGSMDLYCSLLHKDLVDQPSSRELLEKVQQGIRLLDGIIRNCLQFSRDIRLRPEHIEDIEPFLDDVVESARLGTGCKDVVVSIEVAPGSLYADRSALSQIVNNLVRNAFEAAGEKAGGEVVISAGPTDICYRIIVSDNGPGISEELLPNVFEPFVTAKRQGTGLGLSVVHTLVAAHRGQVSINSALGKGTSVTVEFPDEFLETGTD